MQLLAYRTFLDDYRYKIIPNTQYVSLANSMLMSLSPVSRIVADVAAVVVWDVGSSNTSLEYTDSSTSCRRPGSTSCYPAAFARVPSALVSSFSVELTETGSNTNWLSVGLGKTQFPIAISDGFGRSPDSWGIVDDRSRESENAYFAFSGLKIRAAPRKLRRGDVITIILDLQTPRLEITINFGEFTHVYGTSIEGCKFAVLAAGIGVTSFDTPSISDNVASADFVFGATFANDHKLQIDPNLPWPSSNGAGGVSSMTSKSGLTWDQRCVYEISKPQLISLCDVCRLSNLVLSNSAMSSDVNFQLQKYLHDWLTTPLFIGGRRTDSANSVDNQSSYSKDSRSESRKIITFESTCLYFYFSGGR